MIFLINLIVFTVNGIKNFCLVKTSSRYQSYTTLPRPDNVEVFNSHYLQTIQPRNHDSVYKTKSFYDNAMPQKVYTSRPQSTLSNVNKFNNFFYDTYQPPILSPLPLSVPVWPANISLKKNINKMQVIDEMNQLGLKSIVNWNIVSLSSYLQVNLF